MENNNQFLISIIKNDRAKFLNFISLLENDVSLDYFIQLFISQDTNFTEENSIKLPFSQTIELQEIEFELKDFKNIKNLRLDPLNDSCVLNISQIYLVLENDLRIDLKANIQANNSSHHEDTYFFEFFDPQIYFENVNFENLSINKFVIELRYNHIAKNAVHVCVNQILVDKNYMIETKEQVIQSQNQELEIREQIIQSQNQELEIREQIIQSQNQELEIKEQNIQKFIDELMSIYVSKKLENNSAT